MPSGGWAKWGVKADNEMFQGDSSFEILSTTGHHLEWIVMSDPADTPPEDSISRAVEAVFDVTKDIERLGDRTFKPQLPATHAARAMMLISGKENAIESVIGYPVGIAQ